ncbi:MAG TPA: hypothetical protein VGH93_02985, partial [Solirubrobacteraceae bacterium]
MRVNELSNPSQPPARGDVCVVIAASGSPEQMTRCLDSLRTNTPAVTAVLQVAPHSEEVNRALERLHPSDVIVLLEPCGVPGGWLERLRAAARSDTNTGTASALADAGGELALRADVGLRQPFAALAEGLAGRTLRLHPRLRRAVGPCVYVRREAIELVGPLDAELDLRAALELDFAQRCLLSGLAHVAADDVVVERLAPSVDEAGALLTPELSRRYPYMHRSDALGESDVLTQALEAA